MLSTCNTTNEWLVNHPKLEGISLMDHLFSRMNGIYPNKWRANFKDSQAIEDWKLAWAEAFVEDGLTPSDIAVGIKNCRQQYDWPPSLPEFLRACRPALDPEVAFHEAVEGLSARRRGERGKWSHPAIYYAALDAGQHDMINGTYSAMRSRWDSALSKQLEKSEWEPIPEPVVALPAPKHTPSSDMQAEQTMRAVAQAVNTDRQDHKAWARKILDSQKGRPYIAIKMAKAALGVEDES